VSTFKKCFGCDIVNKNSKAKIRARRHRVETKHRSITCHAGRRLGQFIRLDQPLQCTSVGLCDGSALFSARNTRLNQAISSISHLTVDRSRRLVDCIRRMKAVFFIMFSIHYRSRSGIVSGGAPSALRPRRPHSFSKSAVGRWAPDRGLWEGVGIFGVLK
jgi:hypothetical protein